MNPMLPTTFCLFCTTQIIPRQLCNNAGFDATDVLNKLRQKHAALDGSGKVRAGEEAKASKKKATQGVMTCPIN